MQILLNVGGQQLCATLKRSRAARKFAAMLPMKIEMFDLFGREKFGLLGDSLAFHAADVRTKRYSVGEIVCWPMEQNLGIFYRQNGELISGAFHVIGRIDSGTEVFKQRGLIEVQIDRVALDTKLNHSTTSKNSLRRSSQIKLPQAEG